MVFRNTEHRDYYVQRDPVHDAFKKFVGGFIEQDGSFRVVDFRDGRM